MRRPTAKRAQPGVALFPFLAVLICTMGALIVLLVLVVQGAQASVAAERAAAKSKAALSEKELLARQQQAEDMQWQAEMLEKQRAEFAAKLQSKRLELAHLEDHLRRLEDESKQIQAQAEALEQAGKNKLLDHEFAEQQLAELRKQIADKKQELAAAKKKQANQRPAYAIIPYEGPNGTSRRPVYIECREAGIVIQPEGITFAPQDFEGPLGPGNPLDAALRAIREHQAAQGLPGEPYPLIIVRPNGAVAFGACRAAMKHWENEFGYELVEQDAELKYPAPDARLADTLQRTLRDARVRQTALAAAMPNRFGAANKMASFRMEPQEDTTPTTGSGGLGSGNNSGTSGGIGARGTAGQGVGGGYGSPTPSGLAGSGGMAGTGNYAGGSPAGGSLGMHGSGSGGSATKPTSSGPGAQGSTLTGPTSNTAGNLNGNTSGNSNTGGNGNNAGSNTGSRTAGSTGGSANGSQSGSQNGSGGMAGDPTRSGNMSMGNTLRGSSSGSTGGTSSSSSMGSPNASGQANSMTGSAGGQMSNDPQQQQNLSPNINISQGAPQLNAKARKAIQNRGENWGLPDNTSRATAITRPIRVECHEDKLVLLPERNEGRAPLVVPLEGDVAGHVEVLVANVWKHMDRWGLAMVNGYWKPVLRVEVKPGGENRYNELQALLQGSGIEVERKK
jgi:hypothetical protein